MNLLKIQVCVQVHIIQEGKSGMEHFKIQFVFRYTSYKGEMSGMELFKIQVCVQVHIIQRKMSVMELFKIQVCVQVHIIQRENVRHGAL
jgi:hypothetical protein